MMCEIGVQASANGRCTFFSGKQGGGGFRIVRDQNKLTVFPFFFKYLFYFTE